MRLAHKAVTAFSGFPCTCKQQKGKLPGQFSMQGLITFNEKALPLCQCHSGWLCFCGSYTSLEAHLHSPEPGAASQERIPSRLSASPQTHTHGAAAGIHHLPSLHIKESSSDHTDCHCQGRVPGAHGKPCAVLPLSLFSSQEFQQQPQQRAKCTRWLCLVCPAAPVKQGLGTNQPAWPSLPLSQCHTHGTLVVSNTEVFAIFHFGR